MQYFNFLLGEGSWERQMHADYVPNIGIEIMLIILFIITFLQLLFLFFFLLTPWSATCKVQKLSGKHMVKYCIKKFSIFNSRGGGVKETWFTKFQLIGSTAFTTSRWPDVLRLRVSETEGNYKERPNELQRRLIITIRLWRCGSRNG